MATAAAVLTAFYMFRLIFLTFFGEHKSHHAEVAHESPLTMTIPLGTLALVSIIGGGLFGIIGADWFPNKINDFPVAKAAVKGESDTLVSADSATLRIANLNSVMAEPFVRNGQQRTLKPLVFQAKPGEVEQLRAAWAAVGVELGTPRLDDHGGGHGAPAAGGAPAPAHDTTSFGLYNHLHHALHLPTIFLSSILAGLAVLAAWIVFLGPLKQVDLVGKLGLNGYRRVLENLYYVDWFYSKIVVGAVMVTRLVLKAVDVFIVDGIVNLTGWVTRGVTWIAGRVDYLGVDGAVRGTGDLVLGAGKDLRSVQTGRIGDYVWGTIFSLAVIAVAAVIVIGVAL
jgi:NADH:ubiquinone oxidoreductase subunit 5 (subunit L)/multisubunit Na+/H+ antiporter MnhA subunit